MIHKNLRNEAQNDGGFTDLFILGSDKAYDAATKTWGSDFTAAALTQSYNLLQLTDASSVPLYVVQYPLAMVVIKEPTSNSAHNLKIDVGNTAAATAFVAGTAIQGETKNTVVLPAAAAVPYSTLTASQYLTALATSASGNISTLAALDATKGIQIWIYACLMPYRQWVLDREA